MSPRTRLIRVVRATLQVPIDVEVRVDVTDPDRCTPIAADVAGTLSQDRLMRMAVEQFGTVVHAMNEDLEREKKAAGHA